MKALLTTRDLDIPEGVSVEVKARKVRVKGPRGEKGTMEGWALPWEGAGGRRLDIHRPATMAM